MTVHELAMFTSNGKNQEREHIFMCQVLLILPIEWFASGLIVIKLYHAYHSEETCKYTHCELDNLKTPDSTRCSSERSLWLEMNRR
jgi:hypothetical protein